MSSSVDRSHKKNFCGVIISEFNLILNYEGYFYLSWLECFTVRYRRMRSCLLPTKKSRSRNAWNLHCAASLKKKRLRDRPILRCNSVFGTKAKGYRRRQPTSG